MYYRQLFEHQAAVALHHKQTDLGIVSDRTSTRLADLQETFNRATSRVDQQPIPAGTPAVYRQIWGQDGSDMMLQPDLVPGHVRYIYPRNRAVMQPRSCRERICQ